MTGTTCDTQERDIQAGVFDEMFVFNTPDDQWRPRIHTPYLTRIGGEQAPILFTRCTRGRTNESPLQLVMNRIVCPVFDTEHFLTLFFRAHGCGIEDFSGSRLEQPYVLASGKARGVAFYLRLLHHDGRI